MWRESDSTKFERRPSVLLNQSFRKLCDSKLSDSCAFDNITISLNQKRCKNWKCRLWAHYGLICHNKWCLGTTGISTLPAHGSWYSCWWNSVLVTTSNFGLLTLRWHSATKKQLFLYPQGDKSALRKPEEDKYNHKYNHRFDYD